MACFEKRLAINSLDGFIEFSLRDLMCDEGEGAYFTPKLISDRINNTFDIRDGIEITEKTILDEIKKNSAKYEEVEVQGFFAYRIK
jgi:hypothetical protein